MKRIFTQLIFGIPLLFFIFAFAFGFGCYYIGFNNGITNAVTKCANNLIKK